MPFEFFDNLVGRRMLYSRINFDVAPAFNRHLDVVLGTFGPAFFAISPRWEIMLWDSQLNELTGAMEWVLLFLELLYPVTLFVAGAISLVLAMLLTMQLGKNAAIMRSVGASKRSVCAALLGEHLGVFLTGILLGLLAVFTLGWGMSPLIVLAAPAVSLVGAIIGSLLAVIIVVVVRPPISMLQIRE
jgi:ABC-type antimicrobial peptide transport system permease subunit